MWAVPRSAFRFMPRIDILNALCLVLPWKHRCVLHPVLLEACPSKWRASSQGSSGLALFWTTSVPSMMHIIHQVVCADLDGHGKDELLIILMGSDPKPEDWCVVLRV